MGIVIPARSFFVQNQAGILRPVIYCCPYGEVTEKAVSMNYQLAQALSSYKPLRRTMQMEKILDDAIAKLPANSTIKEFDVLFNPAYKVDVLKLLINICKNRSFSIVWPGTFSDNKLIYAEEGYQDYKVFRVDDYDVTCII